MNVVLNRSITPKMPQELHVVRCYACKKFQVQIVKKVPKWQCKVCSEKQSLLKVYAQGSGKECREHVQNLNMQQGLLMSQETPCYESNSNVEDETFHCADNPAMNKMSKWSEYLDDNGPRQADTNSWQEKETSSAGTSMLRGRKRKLSNQDDFQDDCTFEENYSQPEAQVLDLSSGPSGFNNSKSKWSQFVSPKEEDLPPPGNEYSGAVLNSSQDTFVTSAATLTASRVPFAKINAPIAAKGLSIPRQRVKKFDPKTESAFCGNSLSFRRGEKLDSSNTVKNPFCTTLDEDNLDSLLDLS